MSVTSLNRSRIEKGGVNGKPSGGLAESNAPPNMLSKVFPIQSFFVVATDGTQSVLASPQNAEIINVVPRSDSGYSIGLAPWAQTPIALRFKIGAQNGSSSVIILKPGQIVRPQGRRGEPANFNGFEYGLPFGWMGGGLAPLYIFPSAEAELKWESARNEVLFHCQRLTIRESSATPPAQPFYNWPTRFPWTNCYRDVNGSAVNQNGDPSLAIVETTKILVRLNDNTSQASPVPVRAVLFGTNELDHNQDGLTINTSGQAFYDFAFPGNAVIAGMALNTPAVSLPVDIFGLGGEFAGITIDAPTGSTLIGQTVDIVRFGRLG